MKTVVMVITPEMAADWLTKNLSNRPRRASTVSYYATQMTRGQWQITHQGIALDCRGHLVDGQHRLAAIVLAGIPVTMAVSYLDVETSAMYLAVDCGIGRSVSDILKVDKRRMEVCRLIAEIAASSTIRTRRSIDEFQAIYSHLSAYLEGFHKSILNAMCAHRLGTLLATLEQPERAKEIEQQAIWFATGDCCTQWWSSVEALNKTMKQANRSHWSQYKGRLEYVIRWRMAMLNPTHRVSRINDEQLMAREVREQCRDIVKAAGVTL
jgi:aerobic-type carbon monoxide dehydrogenase small subunit (CoxS/CutS family)